ncbi:murein L,D-transpeptidase catalytic domain family protein [Niabella pedocola]|uniref:Murein L,D-transpeptidase catalytic domain family protein n=1 Tax=Niabella pedocola TaxID=1752077 RepID=A0ABS8Q0P7_9BACT|nr:murein L,D-transpeptidase catalytic domain family protein [Niabella pedocola]MCD2426203.1 murein L,D-transpeptidase catalytic domain family protein [Niabella pedocola]
MGKCLFVFILLLACGIYAYKIAAPVSGRQIRPGLPTTTITAAPDNRYKPGAARLLAIKERIRKQGFNPSLVFLIDMQQPSFRKRFFVYDLRRDTVIASGLVTHGRCNEQWLEGRRYSNEVGSRCTSLGDYKIGKSYQGKFGLAYKLYGLDSSNSKAFERFVVLHAHACVPEKEVDYEICQSDGCPTVSAGFLKTLQPVIDAASRPILLSIFD